MSELYAGNGGVSRMPSISLWRWLAEGAHICSRKWRILALVSNKPLNFLLP